MTLICLECATPKSPFHRGEFSSCLVCDRDTHTIEGVARRPLCHDCANFMIPCRDDQWRPAMDYGKEYLSQGSCMGGSKEANRVTNALGHLVAPRLTRYDQRCSFFSKHRNAPNDNRPNPLSTQQRKEWRDFLQMPQAFWLDPRRWEGINDPNKQKFWDKAHPSKKGKVGGIITATAIVAGLFLSSKKVQPATQENKDE